MPSTAGKKPGLYSVEQAEQGRRGGADPDLDVAVYAKVEVRSPALDLRRRFWKVLVASSVGRYIRGCFSAFAPTLLFFVLRLARGLSWKVPFARCAVRGLGTVNF